MFILNVFHPLPYHLSNVVLVILKHCQYMGLCDAFKHHCHQMQSVPDSDHLKESVRKYGILQKLPQLLGP